MKLPPLKTQTNSLGFAKVRPENYLEFENQKLEGADFSGTKARSFGAQGCKFVACNFANLRLESASFGAGRLVTEYTDCNFDCLRFRTGLGGYARFARCSFRDVDLREWFCFAVEMIDCTFSGRMRKVVFNGTPRLEDQAALQRMSNEFRGNDFSGVDLENVSFRTGIDLSKQKLPAGAEYIYLSDAEAVLRRVREEVTAWADLRLRQDAMTAIKALESETNGARASCCWRQMRP